MKVHYTDLVPLELPAGHRFPAGKYPLLRERLAQSGLISPQDVLPSEPASDEALLRVHQPDYLHRFQHGLMTEKEMRRIGFPWSPDLVERARRSVGASLAACRTALIEGCAANLGGGTHHAYPDHGEGYCVFNDVAVSARVMQAEGRLARVVILDCDVHQGNGTAAIFAGDPSVFTFSIHGQKNFPYHKEIGDLDIGLPDGCGDDDYLNALLPGLEEALDRAQAELAIYIAGADPYQGDTLGRMALSKEGLAERDRLVLRRCRQAGLPVAIVMGGGYSRQVEDTVEIHVQTLRLAAEIFT
jgi:acetoin utilization deacetylase AcuC-like enzyme